MAVNGIPSKKDPATAPYIAATVAMSQITFIFNNNLLSIGSGIFQGFLNRLPSQKHRKQSSIKPSPIRLYLVQSGMARTKEALM